MKNKCILIVSILFLTFVITPKALAQQGWLLQDCPTGQFLEGVNFTDANTGTAVGYGTVVRTTNGGVTWTLQTIDAGYLYAVSFVDANTGTVVGDGIFHTSDGGAHWIKQTSVTTHFLTGVSFTDANTGTTVGDSGTILRTTNGGATWVSQSSGTKNQLAAVVFIDATKGTIVGEKGEILHTTNGGTNWTKQTSGTANFLRAVSFTEANIGTAVGDSGRILRTTNSGTTWISQSPDPNWFSADIRGVSFTDANIGTAVGFIANKILHTTNGGATWVVQKGGSIGEWMYAVSFTDAYTGSAVGQAGAIIHTTTGGISSSDTAAQIVVTGSPIKFGKIKVDSNASRTFVIRNNSTPNFPLIGTVTGIKLPFTLQGAPVSFNIIRGDSLVVTVGFAPTATGNYYDTLLVTSNTDADRHIIKVYLSGTGMPADTMAHPEVSVPALDFGNILINAGVTDTLSVTNTGDPFIQWSARISSLKPAPSPFSITSGGGNPLVLAGAASRVVSIKFLPKTAGTFFDTLKITTTDTTNVEAAQRLIVIPINGIGVDPSRVDDDVMGLRKPEVFPNPVEDVCHLKVSLNVLSEVTITIFNGLGTEIRKVNTGKISAGDHIIDLSMDDLAAGAYFCRVRIGTQEKFLRIVVSDSRK